MPNSARQLWLPSGLRSNFNFYEGYKRPRANLLEASVSPDKCFHIFLRLVGSLRKGMLNVILESSHAYKEFSPPEPDQFFSHNIDKAALLSTLGAEQDLFIEDGCSGIAVYDNKNEVHLDEHKALRFIRPDNNFAVAQRIFQECGVLRNQRLKLLREEFHQHMFNEKFEHDFMRVAAALDPEEDQAIDIYGRIIESSAMRVGTPFLAWRKYAALGSASTSVAISPTRGRGCMMIALLAFTSLAFRT